MIKKVVCICVLGLFAFAMFAGVTSAKTSTKKVNNTTPLKSAGYIIHAPIRINSDADFTSQFSNRTIWGLDINGTGYGYCIFIGNCSLPFTVKICHLFNASGRSIAYFNNSGIFLFKSSNGTLLNNYCSGNYWYGIDLISSNINNLINNNCSKNSNYGIFLDSSNNNTSTNNTCNDNLAFGIVIGKSNINKLANNTCNGNTNYGISLSFSHNNTVTNNNCSGNLHHGIYLDYSTTNIITNNICQGNFYYGIYLEYSNINKFTNNDCMSNLRQGIYLAFSNTNNFTNNTSIMNTNYGFFLSSSNTNIFTNNTCKQNLKYGFYIEGTSTKNRIYHNIFINNNGASSIHDPMHVQANDTTGKNFWNNSYPSGGNYWSDWTSPDIKNGPNQNISGSDEIVDLPYILDGSTGVKDFYPLTTYITIPESTPPIFVIILLIIIPIILIKKYLPD